MLPSMASNRERQLAQLNSELQEREEPSPLAITQSVIGRLALLPQAVKEHWEAELRSISLAAAAAGDFASAVDGYRELGKSYGKTNEGPQSQHVHFHDAEVVREQPTEALEARLAHLREKRTTPIAAEVIDDDTADFLGG